MITALNNYDFAHPVEVIAASVRHNGHVVAAAMMGADIATVPFAVLQKLVKHPLTDRGLESFLADWEKVRNA
jgi:transaldolase